MNTKPSWNRWFLARKTSATSVKMRPLQTKMMFEQIWLKYATCVFMRAGYNICIASCKHTAYVQILHVVEFQTSCPFWILARILASILLLHFPLFDPHWWQMSSCFSKSLENAAIASGLPISSFCHPDMKMKEKVPKWSCPWKHESIMGAHVHGPSPRDLRRNHFLEGRVQPWNPFVMRVPCFGGKSLWVSHGLLGGETAKLLAPL